MATAHQYSVITNSCVKPPVNPKTGLASTHDERKKADPSGTWNGRDADYMDALEDPRQLSMSRSVNFDTSNTFMDTLPADIADLSDDEFYGRLSDLRAEHKKTLETCERLYNEKVGQGVMKSCFPERNAGRPRSPSPTLPVATMDTDYTISSMKQRIDELNCNLEELRKSYNTLATDRVKDLSSSKPPSGKPIAKKSDALPTRTVSRMSGKSWTQSGDEQRFWKPLSAASSQEDLSQYQRNQMVGSLEHPKSMEEAVSRIQSMWKDFSIDEYAPRRSTTLRRSNSLTRLSTARSASGDRLNDSKEWKPKITIPKPFKMTLREAQKSPKKTKAMKELDERKQKEKRKEELECQKKFKATPIPAHVYLPLYDEIMEEKETRRRRNKQNCADFIRSSVKPFKFSEREEEKRLIRHAKNANMWRDDEPQPSGFRAKPYPAHLFNSMTEDQAREDEEYRRIRMQMRAEELLMTSSLPPNMKSRGSEYVMGKHRTKQRAKNAPASTEVDFTPRVNNSIPDFEELHKKFQKTLCKKKFNKEATVCKPFNLRTSTVASSKSKVYNDSIFSDEPIKENIRPRTAPIRSRSLSKSSSLDSIPAKMTTAAELRQSNVKTKLRNELEQQLEREREDRRRRYRETQLKKAISDRVAANDKSSDLRSHTEAKLREYKASERARNQEYRKQLKEINNRVKSRPLLIEQAAEANAKRAADKRYKDALNRAGLNEDFIKYKGSKADSSSVPFDDEDEISQVFSSRRSASLSARSGQSIDAREYSGAYDEPTMRSRASSEVESDLDMA